MPLTLVRAVTKGSLLILHPFIRDRVKFQSWTRAYIHTHSPTHQIHELIVLKSYAPVVRSPAVKSSKNLVVKYVDFQHGGRLKLQQAFLPLRIHVGRKSRNDFTAPLCALILALFIAGAGIELLMMMTVRIGKESFCKWA